MSSNVIYVSFGDRSKSGGGDGLDSGIEGKSPGQNEPVSAGGSDDGFHFQGDQGGLADLYTRRQVSCLLGVPEQKLRWWERCGIVTPSSRDGRRRYYTFENLITVRAVKELTERGCRAAHIKRAIANLGKEILNSGKPLAKMKVCGNAGELVIEREGRDVDVDDGQVIMDFSIPSVSAQKKDREVPSPGAAGPGMGKSAYEWFLEGIRLEDDEDPSSISMAEKAYRNALEVDPGMAPAMTNLGNIKYRKGEAGEAEQFWKSAIRDDPCLPQPYYNLGCLKLASGRPDIAVVFLRRALELDPEFADVHFQLAIALEQEGKKDDAISSFERFLEFEEDSPWSRIARSHIEKLM